MSTAHARGADDGILPAGGTLFHVAPGGGRADAPRLLLITYHFPPDPVVGGLRWQQMTRHFGERGWVTDVVTRDFAGDTGLDRGRLEGLAPGTRIFSVPDRDPLLTRIQRRVWPWLRRFRARAREPRVQSVARGELPSARGGRSLIRAVLAWQDFAGHRNWARAAARVGTALARSRPYAAIISSGPPHMAHVASRDVGLHAHVPYVVDMRDPWSLVEHVPEEFASPVWYWLARHYERRVLRDAALVTMNTDAGRDAMRSLYPELAGRFETIRNGCDDDAAPAAHRDGVFRIRFAGSIYIDRDPRLVFRAVARVVDTLGLTPDQLLIEFAGDVDRYAGRPTMQIAEEEGVAAYVRFHGTLPRNVVLKFLAGATVLLSLPQDTDYAIPAKIYEYLRMEAWMLVLAHPGGATAQLLERTDADVLAPEDVDGITRAITMRYQEFARGVQPQAVGRDGSFDRRVQSEKLLRSIEALAGSPLQR